jgi:hypothetical protein
MNDKKRQYYVRLQLRFSNFGYDEYAAWTSYAMSKFLQLIQTPTIRETFNIFMLREKFVVSMQFLL